MMHSQLQQVGTLFLLLLVGKYVAHIYLPWSSIVALLLFTTIIEHSYIYIKEKKLDFFSFSALSTSIGVMLMMATPHLWIYAVVIGLGLLQKHILTINGRHFFNPSNFALLLGLMLFYSDAHIVLGQLGDSLWLEVVIILLAILILYRVDRWIIPIVFSLSYLLLQYLLVVSYDPVLIMEEVYHRFYSVSFMVFVLFMLTDPRTTPSRVWQQSCFALFVAFIAVCFDRLNGFRVQHLFMALFLLSLFVPLLTLWQQKSDKKYLFIMTLTMFFLALSAIIFIEGKPPYYFEMDG